MKSTRHQHYLEKMALREAQKQMQRHGSDSFHKEGIGRLRIQTVELWKRLVVAGASLFFAVITGVSIGRDYHPAASSAFGLIAVLLMIAAIVGRKKTIDEIVEVAGDSIARAVQEADWFDP